MSTQTHCLCNGSWGFLAGSWLWLLQLSQAGSWEDICPDGQRLWVQVASSLVPGWITGRHVYSRGAAEPRPPCSIYYIFFVTGQMRALFAMAQTCLPDEEGLLGIASGSERGNLGRGSGKEGEMANPKGSPSRATRITSCAASVLARGRACSFLSV